MLTPQLVGFREIVRGIDIEEDELGIGQSPYVRERENTDPDAVVKADSTQVSCREAIRDRFPAGWAVRGTQGLNPSAAAALWKHGIVLIQAGGQRPYKRFRDEGHVPGDAHYGGWSLDDSRVDPAQGSKAGAKITHRAEIRSPVWSIRRVRHDKWRLANGGSHRGHQPVEDTLSADELEAFGSTSESGRPTSGENGALKAYPLTCFPAYHLNTAVLSFSRG